MTVPKLKLKPESALKSAANAEERLGPGGSSFTQGKIGHKQSAQQSDKLPRGMVILESFLLRLIGETGDF
jgi:hypothetical protein